MLKKYAFFFVGLIAFQSNFAQSKIEFWLTKGDQTVLLQKQTNISFGNKPNEFPTIEINENQTFQTIDGFGYSLTGGVLLLSISLINLIKRNFYKNYSERKKIRFQLVI